MVLQLGTGGQLTNDDVGRADCKHLVVVVGDWVSGNNKTPLEPSAQASSETLGTIVQSVSR